MLLRKQRRNLQELLRNIFLTHCLENSAKTQGKKYFAPNIQHLWVRLLLFTQTGNLRDLRTGKEQAMPHTYCLTYPLLSLLWLGWSYWLGSMINLIIVILIVYLLLIICKQAWSLAIGRKSEKDTPDSFNQNSTDSTENG